MQPQSSGRAWELNVHNGSQGHVAALAVTLLAACRCCSLACCRDVTAPLVTAAPAPLFATQLLDGSTVHGSNGTAEAHGRDKPPPYGVVAGDCPPKLCSARLCISSTAALPA